jgi:fructuronate reductase
MSPVPDDAAMNDSQPRLAPDTLAALPDSTVERPGYRREALRSGIVHLGLGAFARAHLALATEQAIARTQDLRWGITGVSMRQPDTWAALAPQAGLYTLAERDAGADGAPRERLQVIGCVRELLVAPRDEAVVVERLAAAGTRIVSLTITEKGYASVGDGSAADLIVRALAARRAHGRGGVTLLSLDNLPGNGHHLRQRVLERAADEGEALDTWIDAHCSFPNSMVDRIVPRTTAADVAAVSRRLGLHDAWPVVAEPFFDWVVEDHFIAGRPDWLAPVRYAADAAPWEQVKLRLVNGAHSQIAYCGAMAGWPTVDAAIGQPLLATHVEALLRDEMEPTLPQLAGWDGDAYRAALLQRWRNPALAHRCQQIAMDGSQKIPQRWVAPLTQRLAAGAPIHRLAFGVAAWIHYLRGLDETGAPYPIDDPLGGRLQAALGGTDALADARALTDLPAVFGPLAGHPRLAAEAAVHLQRLRVGGVVAALAQLAGQASPPPA